MYVADNARAPYGPQQPEEINRYSHEITAALLAAGAKMIVVACNTATSLAIDDLRATYPNVPFVGLEPAIKPAATAGRVGVMATAATLASARYQRLKQRYMPGVEVVEDACRGLVTLIEQEPPDSPLVEDKVRQIVTPMLRAGVATIVLGCTHYPIVEDIFRDALGPEVNVFSQPDLVAEALADYLERRPEMKGPGQVSMFLTTADPGRVSDQATRFLRRRIDFHAA